MKKFIALFVLGLVFFKANAQQDLTLYNMRYVPQASYSNAAFIPEAKVYFGMPGLSGLYLNVSHNGFKWREFVKLEPSGDTFNLKLDVANALSNMNKTNIFSEEVRADLLTFGIKLGNNHLAFNITSKQTFSFRYTRDLFALLLVGNGLTPAESKSLYGSEDYGFLGNTVDLSGTGINFMQYTEIGVKYTRSLLDDKLKVGIRPKLLLGSVNFQTKSSEFTLYTDPATYALTGTGGFAINTCIPSGFLPDTGSFKFDPKYIIGGNIGLGLDLGITYKLNEDLEVSAALNDLGYINWRGNPKNYTTDNFSIEFKGITGIEDQLIKDPNSSAQGASDSTKSQLSSLGDSLLRAFTPDTTYNPYSTGLGLKFNAGVRYQFTKKQSVAAMISLNSVAQRIRPAVSLAYSLRFYKWFGFTAAYNAYNGSFSNIGAGLSFNIFPLQFHLVSDNLLAVDPSNTKNLNVRFGMNWVIGHDKGDQKEKRNF